jgi:hypothetical protein
MIADKAKRRILARDMINYRHDNIDSLISSHERGQMSVMREILASVSILASRDRSKCQSPVNAVNDLQSSDRHYAFNTSTARSVDFPLDSLH